MNDQELLRIAQDNLTQSDAGRFTHEQQAHMVQQSIAASLLVIARNSMPQIDSMNVDPAKPRSVSYEGTDFEEFHMVEITEDNAEVLHFTCNNLDDCVVMHDLDERIGTSDWLRPGDYIARNQPGCPIIYDLSGKEKVKK